ncbi:MAG: hypothetical protein HRU29_05610 [Rhizobiales bacterium]|nr:hypothetical protein [Hyphomicrobiales bacterium]NRB13861.1 hypothetical protein [Hyphomicrobiales bacterium]
MKSVFELKIDNTWNLSIFLDLSSLLIILLIMVFVIASYLYIKHKFLSDVVIDKVHIGLGSGKITLKNDPIDKNIAYKIWLELKTRKIGQKIDFENDVIIEIYNSWYDFFQITRELLKDIPSDKVHRSHTKKIINLSIEVLNVGMRPHLTEWQAKFRRWYGVVEVNYPDLSPQEIQKKYPYFDELTEEMTRINNELIIYCDELYKLVSK